MIWSSDGIKVEQVEIDGLEKPVRCPICGRIKHGDQPCKRDRQKYLMKLYVNREFEINQPSPKK